MTQVEKELASTKALLERLRQQQGDGGSNEPSLSPLGVGRETATPSAYPPRSLDYGRSPGYSKTASIAPQQALFTHEDIVSPSSENMRPSNVEHRIGMAQMTSSRLDTPSTDKISRSHRSIMISLESPPTAENFEWDERNGKLGGRKFVDGMGSLTSNTNGSGYLGGTSLQYYVAKR